MDYKSRAVDVIKTYNAVTAGRIEDYVLLSKVCEYFDSIKNQNLSDADKRFLLHISSKVGVPHYYDMLQKFNQEFNSEIDEKTFDLQVISSLLFESSLYTDENAKLHKYQKDVLNLFILDELNRYFLSASTSFGKTHLVYEIIRKKKYQNIVLIFPTIALLSENLDRIRKNGIQKINNYKVQTLSDVDDITSKNNIYIFTPERFLSFIDKVDKSFKIDFLFVDEIYKIDKGLIIDGDAKENERDVAYRLAMFQALNRFPDSDVLLVGPYINLYNKQSSKYKPSFDNFLMEYGIKKIDKNKYEIVKVKKADIEKEKANYHFDEIDFDFTGKKNKKDKVQEVCDKVISRNENIIV
ncbi:MAG TPA: DEAD/DEAH box helicase, partial [Chitinophagales bacterium]|nr:DEAD/DEAH box helicase [Chitinophagales bacterium]